MSVLLGVPAVRLLLLLLPVVVDEDDSDVVDDSIVVELQLWSVDELRYAISP